ncbi:hypothetical protein M408DRAFT_76966 [Serendipita vermifera MAFF 305830]|uniref:Alpha/beta hydrolase fold-3 domain-containing protein n=1 Tax=Serendipita vermifera MAFF 305830 TaxID=933852 RepID=A0A0C2WBJ9_SERVB|nr:hypothetical protein M408DRAFT_76966 [Serendipita vermifera MAFF 305830]
MASHSAYNIEYYQILSKIQVIRSIRALAGFLGRWSGKVPTSDILPSETLYVPSTKGNRRITVNVYRTKGAEAQSSGRPIPVYINWHSSGFVIDAFGESVPFIAHLLSHPLLEQYPLLVLDCDYAKAPECPSPAATDDVRDVLEFVFSLPEKYDLNRVTIGGFSAGASMALGISAIVGAEAKDGKPLGKRSSVLSSHPIKAVIAFYPPTERALRPEVHIPPGVTFPGIVTPKFFTDVFAAAYFYPPTPLTEEERAQRIEKLLQSPLHTPRWANPRDFPKIIGLITCEYDNLSVEAEKLRAELMKDEYEKDVKGWMAKGVGHGWDVMVLPGQPGFEERQKSYDLAAEIIAQVGISSD